MILPQDDMDKQAGMDACPPAAAEDGMDVQGSPAGEAGAQATPARAEELGAKLEQTEGENPEEEDKSWRSDKFGKELAPGALYMRFLRGVRSSKTPPPPEVLSKITESERSQNLAGAKMHSLYEHFLACRGNWSKSALLVSVRKEHSTSSDEIYSWVRYKDLVDKLGDELAADLKARHVEQEAKLPPAAKGKFIRVHPDFPGREDCWLFKSFLTINDTKSKKQSHSASVEISADVDGNDAMDAL